METKNFFDNRNNSEIESKYIVNDSMVILVIGILTIIFAILFLNH